MQYRFRMPSENSTAEITKEPVVKKTSIAHKLAEKQQEISVTEFFEKNKHILGFDSRSKSLLMGIKEAVDNSLDACEEANILPDIFVRIDSLGDEEYKIVVEDNGPGIVHRMMPNVFGRLLYGSNREVSKVSESPLQSCTVTSPPEDLPTLCQRLTARLQEKWTSSSIQRPTDL